MPERRERRPAAGRVRDSASSTASRLGRRGRAAAAPAIAADANAAPRANRGRRLRPLEQRQRVGGAFVLQEVGGEIEPRADIVRFARDGFAQQLLGRLGLRR